MISPTRLHPSEVATYYRDVLPDMRQVGREWRGKCPIHNGSGNNFAVNAETGQYYCHSQCQSGGDVFDLEQRLTGSTFPEALQEVARITGRDLSPVEATHQHTLESTGTFKYTDIAGQLLFEIRRRDCTSCDFKECSAFAPNGKVGVVGIERVPYNPRTSRLPLPSTSRKASRKCTP